jgi:hypothetical protein
MEKYVQHIHIKQYTHTRVRDISWRKQVLAVPRQMLILEVTFCWMSLPNLTFRLSFGSGFVNLELRHSSYHILDCPVNVVQKKALTDYLCICQCVHKHLREQEITCKWHREKEREREREREREMSACNFHSVIQLCFTCAMIFCRIETQSWEVMHGCALLHACTPMHACSLSGNRTLAFAEP